MSNRLKELREKRGKIAHDMRGILDAAAAEGRSPTDEEIERHEKLFEEQDALRKQIEAEERQQELDREAAAAAEAEERAQRDGGEGENTPEARAQRAFARYLRGGTLHGEGVEELRALSADADTEGGFLVAPEQFVQQLIKAIDDQTFVRTNATTFQIGMAESLGAPTLESDPADADWTSELGTGSEDSSMSFGKRSLHPHPLAKRLKVSRKLLIKALLGAERLVRDRLAYKFAITHEKAFLTGSGSNQPLGVFTASSDGISTGRDVSEDNTTTEITADGLINAKFSLKGQYWSQARWLFHRDALKQITKLKDGDGRYLWLESMREGEPDRILGRPVDMSEYAPNTFTTGNYVGLLAAWSHYWIADAMAMQIQRLDELYAETNQVGFIGRLESDGMPVLEEAFARVKLA